MHKCVVIYIRVGPTGQNYIHAFSSLNNCNKLQIYRTPVHILYIEHGQICTRSVTASPWRVGGSEGIFKKFLSYGLEGRAGGVECEGSRGHLIYLKSYFASNSPIHRYSAGAGEEGERGRSPARRRKRNTSHRNNQMILFRAGIKLQTTLNLFIHVAFQDILFIFRGNIFTGTARAGISQKNPSHHPPPPFSSSSLFWMATIATAMLQCAV